MKETVEQTEGLCKEAATNVRNAYDRGYKQGFKDGLADLSRQDYEKGLNDAWTTARKVLFNANLPKSLLEELSVSSFAGVIENCSASEVIQKIEELEKQNNANSGIIVGDEVVDDYYGRGVVTRVCNNTCAITWLDTGTNGVLHASSVKQTGRFYSAIADLLKDAVTD